MCDTVMIDGEKFLIVPIRKYERPNGKLTNEQFHVPWSEKLEYNLDAMIECDYHITFEVVPGHMVNICVEDDDNDYAVELVKHDDIHPVRAISNVIEHFIPEHYDMIRRHAQMHDEY